MTADTTYGAYATAFNTKVDAALAASQTTGNAGGTFAAAGVAPAPVNGTFALTTSIDAIVGGAGDDAITAAATSASTGTANTTVNSGDSVDGGAGTDTLTITVTAANNNSLSGLTVKNVEKIVVSGSDNLAVTAAGSATAADGAKQILDFVVSAGAASGTPTVSVVINGVTHTATYSGSATAADALTNKANAIKGVITKVLGGTVTVSGTAPELLVTSTGLGMALPTITATANDGASSAVVAALSADSSTGATQKAVPNAAKTAGSAVSQIITATLNDGDTGNFASGQTVTIYVDGVSRGTISVAAASEATAAANIVTELNKVLGTGVASSTGSQITITAPTAGTTLPHIALTLSSIDTDQTSSAAGTGENIVFAVARENIAVGAATTTTTTAATVAASQFTDATSISVNGKATTVSALTTQSVTLSGTSMVNTLKYASTATSGSVVLSGASGQITVDDNSTDTLTEGFKTLSVSGTGKTTAASTTDHTAAAPNTITLVDTLGTSGAGTITTLNLSVTNATIFNTASLDKLTTIDASASTGNLEISADETKLGSVAGGAGNDKISVDFDTEINGSSAPAAASLNGGAGNDTLELSNADFGTGTLSIDGGAGDDVVKVNYASLNTRLSVSGGEGSDTIYFTPSTTALTAGELALISSQTSSFEKARFATLTSLDASKATAYSSLQMDVGATVTKIADSQSLTVKADTTAVTAGYIPAGTAGSLATVYGGALNVTLSGGADSNSGALHADWNVVTASADTITLNVGANVSATANDARTSSWTSLTGDVKAATIVMSSAANYATGPSSDVISTFYLKAEEDASSSVYTKMGNLSSITLQGVGNVTIDNSDTATVGGSTVSGSKLASVDASAFGGVKSSFDATNAGKPLGGLAHTGNTYLAETVTLGSGLDVVTIKSTYDKMDTINNFKLIGNADLTLNTALSDDISVAIAGSETFAKIITGLTGSTLGAVLTQVAAGGDGHNGKVFQWNGDTYVFSDSSDNSTGLDAGDTVVKLTGLIDLDLLVLALS
jgi:S-layer protein